MARDPPDETANVAHAIRTKPNPQKMSTMLASLSRKLISHSMTIAAATNAALIIAILLLTFWMMALIAEVASMS